MTDTTKGHDTMENQNQKFIDAATADYEALYKDRDMIAYLAELYEQLHLLAPDVYHIDLHWSFIETQHNESFITNAINTNERKDNV